MENNKETIINKTINTIIPITNEEMMFIDNNLESIVNEYIEKNVKDKELAIGQYIIKKQQNKIDKVYKYLYQFKNDLETGGIDVSYVLSILNDTVEILPEENDELEDIYTLDDIKEHHFMNRQNGMTQEDRRILDSNFKLLGETINQLIKNQKCIIEKLESKDE